MPRPLLLALTILATTPLAAFEPPASWTREVAPVRITDNLYYVGSEELASFLVTSDSGHILIDAPMAENVPRLITAIESLGFDPADIRYLLNTQAHMDHAGGLAEMKRRTGAKLLLSTGDVPLAARGGRNDFAFGDDLVYEPVEADGEISDGDVIEAGGSRLTAILTPGHTEGATSFLLETTDGGAPVRVFILSSLTAPGYRLVDNAAYPKIADDFLATYEKLATIEADIFVASHASFFHLLEKMKRLGDGSPNPFVDRTELPTHVERMRKRFLEELQRQRSEPTGAAAE